MVKKALCCGLNYPKQQYQLYGCVNDCLNWEHLLKHTFHFDETRVLIDQHPDGSLATAPTQIPTHENILAQLGWLCSGAEPGDCLAFIYAGHGIQVISSQGEVDEALVPEDFTSGLDEHGNPPLVWNDELHSLFARVPAGSFLTVVLDCCHASSMLDVPCSVDSSQRPPKVHQTCTRPQEAPRRAPQNWQEFMVQHAQARPRFIPAIRTQGPPRPRRTSPGTGAHVNRMTLDPGVTAFCFAASRTTETALDANIKAHQQGVLSFCLLEALSMLRNRCTYEQLLEKASLKMDDIREKYIVNMDQFIHLSFCPNSAPSEVVVLDERYATVAQHRLFQRAQLAERGQSGDGQGGFPPGVQDTRGVQDLARESSNDFVPSPMYQGQGPGPGQNQAPPGHVPGAGHHAGAGAGRLFVRVLAGHQLKNRDTGLFGDVSDPYVKVRLGSQEHRTPVVNNNLNPVWSKDNEFTFQIGEREANSPLQLEVVNSNMMKDQSLGHATVDLRRLPPGQWQRCRERLTDGTGDVELDLRLELAGYPGPANNGAGPPQQGHDRPYADPAYAPPYHGNGGPPNGGLNYHPDAGGRQYSRDEGNQYAAAAAAAATGGLPPAGPPLQGNLFGTPDLLSGIKGLMGGALGGAAAQPPAQGPLGASQVPGFAPARTLPPGYPQGQAQPPYMTAAPARNPYATPTMERSPAPAGGYGSYVPPPSASPAPAGYNVPPSVQPGSPMPYAAARPVQGYPPAGGVPGAAPGHQYMRY